MRNFTHGEWNILATSWLGKQISKRNQTMNSNGYDRAASSISTACFQALFSMKEAFL